MPLPPLPPLPPAPPTPCIENSRPVAATGPAITARPTGLAGQPRRRGQAVPAGPARPAVTAADQAISPAGPAVTTVPARGRRVPTGPAVTALAPQTSRPACPTGPTVGAIRAGPAVAAVADNPPAVPAGLPGPRRAIGAVADQRTPGDRLNFPIDRVEQALQRVALADSAAAYCAPPACMALYELLMKQRRLRAERLILLRGGAK